MPFHLGSLGFLTPFNFDTYQSQVTQVIEGERPGLPAPSRPTFYFRLEWTLSFPLLYFYTLCFPVCFQSRKFLSIYRFFPISQTLLCTLVHVSVFSWEDLGSHCPPAALGLRKKGVVVETILPFSITGKLSLR